MKSVAHIRHTVSTHLAIMLWFLSQIFIEEWIPIAHIHQLQLTVFASCHQCIIISAFHICHHSCPHVHHIVYINFRFSSRGKCWNISARPAVWHAERHLSARAGRSWGAAHRDVMNGGETTAPGFGLRRGSQVIDRREFLKGLFRVFKRCQVTTTADEAWGGRGR